MPSIPTTPRRVNLGAFRTPAGIADPFDLDAARVRRQPRLGGVLLSDVSDSEAAR